MPLSKNNPFCPYEGGQLNYRKFAGRIDLRQAFSQHVGWSEDGQRLERKNPPHWVWVIEGARGYGKSAFGAWCEAFPNEVRDAGKELLVIKVKAPQSDSNSNIPAFDQILEKLDEALWKAAQARRKTWTWTFLRHWLKRQRICQKIVNAVSKGKILDDNQIRTGRLVIETIRDSTKDIEDLKTIVIVLDDLGEHEGNNDTLSSVESSLVGLVNEFVETRPRDGFSIRMILLPYPGFVNRIPPGRGFPRRAGSIVSTTLEPFSLPDTEALTERALCEAGADNEEVIRYWGEWLHAASGGIPDLVQALGWQAYNTEQPKGSLTPNAVVTVARNPQEILLNKLIAQLQIRGVGRGFFNEKEVPLMRCLREDVPMEQIESVRKSESEWKTLLKERSSSTTSSDLKDFWKKLVSSKLMLPDDDGEGNQIYGFFAEAIRINLYACTR